MNRDRLQHLITILQAVPPERFNLIDWTIGATASNPCGTAACAIGHAMFDPVFNAQGFCAYRGSPDLTVDGRSSFRWNAVQDFFELSHESAQHLFSGYSYGEGEPHVTTQQVIDRITLMLETQ